MCQAEIMQTALGIANQSHVWFPTPFCYVVSGLFCQMTCQFVLCLVGSVASFPQTKLIFLMKERVKALCVPDNTA